MNRIKWIVFVVGIITFLNLPSYANEKKNNAIKTNTEFTLFEHAIVICATSYTVGYKTKNCTSIDETSEQTLNLFKGISIKDKKDIYKLAKSCCIVGTRDVENKTNNFPKLYTTLYSVYEKFKNKKQK